MENHDNRLVRNGFGMRSFTRSEKNLTPNILFTVTLGCSNNKAHAPPWNDPLFKLQALGCKSLVTVSQPCLAWPLRVSPVFQAKGLMVMPNCGGFGVAFKGCQMPVKFPLCHPLFVVLQQHTWCWNVRRLWLV